MQTLRYSYNGTVRKPIGIRKPNQTQNDKWKKFFVTKQKKKPPRLNKLFLLVSAMIQLKRKNIICVLCVGLFIDYILISERDTGECMDVRELS